MAKAALIERRPWLLASLIASLAFYFYGDAALEGIPKMVMKASAVTLLAVYAWLRHDSGDAKILALAMLFGAAGDAGVEIDLTIGGTLFFAEHVALIAIFLKHVRKSMTGSQKALAVMLLLGTPLISYLITMEFGIALYALALGGMAASAWASRFSRYHVGIGAVLFVVSDLLIFAELGPLADSAIPSLLIWPLYYTGQFLICTGIIQTMRGDLKSSQ